VAESSLCTRNTATSCAGASSTRWSLATQQAAGARLLEGHEALEAIVERGFVRGAVVQTRGDDGTLVQREIRAEFIVVADGANSRFGRALGTFRTREWPYGHGDPHVLGVAAPRGAVDRVALDVKDRNGNPMPGYGWIFPVGDGTINIGVGLLSTFRDFKSVNTTHLLDAYAHQIAERWQIDPAPPSPRRRAAGSRWAARSDRRVDRPTSSSATPQAV
jgi:flavin-dependent dehydrogenase